MNDDRRALIEFNSKKAHRRGHLLQRFHWLLSASTNANTYSLLLLQVDFKKTPDPFVRQDLVLINASSALSQRAQLPNRSLIISEAIGRIINTVLLFNHDDPQEFMREANHSSS